MPVCPVCGNAAAKPKTSLVILQPLSAPTSKTAMTQSAVERKKQMPFACSVCGSRFPVKVDRKTYAIVPVVQLKQIQGKIMRFKNEQARLNGKIVNLGEEREKLKQVLRTWREESEVKQLENRLNSLEGHVTHLKRDRQELEERMTDLSPQQ